MKKILLFIAKIKILKNPCNFFIKRAIKYKLKKKNINIEEVFLNDLVDLIVKHRYEITRISILFNKGLL